jgi:MFS family permease
MPEAPRLRLAFVAGSPHAGKRGASEGWLEGTQRDAQGAASGGEAEAEAEFQRQVLANLPRNFTAHIVHGLLGQTGFRLIQAPTFLSAYVYALSGSDTAVGLSRASQALGMLLTPVIGATLIEHRRKVLPMVFGTGAGMRLSVLGLALAGYFLGDRANLIAICVFLGLYGFFTGMQSVTFSFLVSKVIPVDRRGALGGARNALAGVVASSVAFVGGFIVERNTLGNGYATVFLVAFALATGGLLSMLFIREPESPGVRPRRSLGPRLRELPALLRSDPGYRAYMFARALGAAGTMAVPYYAIYAGKHTALPGKLMGFVTAAYLVTQTVSSVLWGLLGDRKGFRAVLWSSLLTWTCSTVVIAYGQGLPAVLLGFIALGAGQGGFQLGSTNLVLEFGAREDLPMRIAVAQTAEQLVSVAAPMLGALLIAQSSYQHMFWATVALQGAGCALTLLRVSEPRKRVQPTRPIGS